MYLLHTQSPLVGARPNTLTPLLSEIEWTQRRIHSTGYQSYQPKADIMQPTVRQFWPESPVQY